MRTENVTVRDPRILSVDYENHTITFETANGDRISLDPGTIVEGHGDHYFEGTFSEIRGDNGDIGTDHHWVTFENATVDDEQYNEHTMPLGELADQIDENGLSIY